jgi:hypothetical protein
LTNQTKLVDQLDFEFCDNRQVLGKAAIMDIVWDDDNFIEVVLLAMQEEDGLH